MFEGSNPAEDDAIHYTFQEHVRTMPNQNRTNVFIHIRPQIKTLLQEHYNRQNGQLHMMREKFQGNQLQTT
jgi:hypothetical protein